MNTVAQGIALDSLLIGGASAKASAAGEQDADTGDWQPGDSDSARKAMEALGLAALLAALAGKSSADLEDGYLGAVAGELAGADGDMGAGDLGGALAGAVADEELAGRLVIGQVCIIAGQAAMAWYLANGSPLLQWIGVVDSRICPACLANVNADPRPAGVPWPSGDTEPPVHPGGCRCGLTVVSGGAAGIPSGPDDIGEPGESGEPGADEGDEEAGGDAEGDGEGEEPEPAESASAGSGSSWLPLAATATAAAVADKKQKRKPA